MDQQPLPPTPKFSPGQIVATPGALAALASHGCTAAALLARHLAGDWGCIPPEDARANEQALASGNRILSAYVIGLKIRVWIVTEGDRSVTTLLMPSEY